jgi:ABC-2 type transport system permease protein
MISLIKVEFRKLLTVRSTYFITGIVFVLAAFFAFYIAGYKIDKPDLFYTNTIASAVSGANNVIAIFSSLIAVLLMTHEYRYNTIMYTLTSSNSRSKVLAAKIFVLTCFAVVFTVIFGLMSPLMTRWGISAHHLKLVPQTYHYWTIIWHNLFFGWGYVMVALLFAVLIRNQIGTIITLFIVPGTVEAILGLLLKKNVVYLPFTALHKVIGENSGGVEKKISADRAALIFLAYLVVGWIIAWYLFIKRDATN